MDQFQWHDFFNRIETLNTKSTLFVRRFLLQRLRTENYQLVVTVVMKNCEPLVSGPAFAIDRSPVSKNITLNFARYGLHGIYDSVSTTTKVLGNLVQCASA